MNFAVGESAVKLKGTLQLKGMSAQQVRAIPSEVLSQNLAYKDFSVVYCVKIKDASEEGYYSKISVDYTADMFAGTTLSLQLVMVDGTENVLSGLTDTVVEDFMTWYTTYPAHRGSNVYQIKQGTKYFFVNRDLIQSISVTEG